MTLTVCSLAFTVTAFGGDRVDRGVSADRFPGDDAVILRWEQSWTVSDDGSLHRRDHKWIKLFNRRPIRSQADPRIDFVKGRDQVTVHAARTHLPGGSVIDSPDYGYNIASPADVAGWPAYDGWQQQIVSFSGIEPGAVLEFDYEVVTPAGVLPWIEGSVVLHNQYPIVEREVTVSIPKSTVLHFEGSGSAFENVEHKDSKKGTVHKWIYRNVPGDRTESQAPAIHQRGGLFSFSTCPSAKDWTQAILKRVEKSAERNALSTSWATRAIGDETDRLQQVRAVAKKMKESFNFVASPKAIESLDCRDADEVVNGHYGNPLELASVLSAAYRSLGLKATPLIAVDTLRWLASSSVAPTAADLAAVVVAVELDGAITYVHPQHGVIQNPGTWGDKTLLGIDQNGAMVHTYVARRGVLEPSELAISGKIGVDGDWKASGELRVRLSGVFFDPAKLEESGAQKKLVEDMVGRVLVGFDVESHSVSLLSQDEFRATVSVASKEKLTRRGEIYVLELGHGPAFLKEVPLPLARSSRRHAVLLNGQVRERIDLTLELPGDVKIAFAPAPRSFVAGEWGSAGQEVLVDGKTVRFVRAIDLVSNTVGAADFKTLRSAVNDLRVARSLVVGLR